MRLSPIAAAFLIMGGASFAQSTVGNVPSNPNAMPAVNGSSGPRVSSSSPATGTTPAAPKRSAKTHKNRRKAASSPD